MSIVWLNYNSSKFFNIVLKSLEAIVDMDYPKDKYELIVVDNGSVDGSFECIVKFLEGKGTLRSKIVRLNRNLGFTGGANVGFSARDPESKYIVLLNNDAIPMKHSLTTMVEYAEKYDKVAALNGVILQYDGRLIDTAGNLIDELL
ncbi:MAG: glycosyltransferase, partial [Candidatus Korarchaeum sp.]|nr:glycosyltransferase [Candidatus Korarchaeum sp.]